MKFEQIKLFKEQQFSIEKELDSGKYCVSFPVFNGLIEYEEYYEISDQEFNLFLLNTDLLIEFTNKCILHQFEERLMKNPSMVRGARGVISVTKSS